MSCPKRPAKPACVHHSSCTSTATMRPHTLALLLLLLATPAATRLASAACAGEKFPAGRAYAACEDLPKLGASLHWTYDAAKSSLSVAFVAAPAAAGGWVAWGLNPTGEGMAGAQALVALAGSGSGSAAPTVRTYNITGYVPLGNVSTPLDFPATDLAADAAAGGRIRVYGTLQLREGMRAVNQVWQVGASSTAGAPDKHAFQPDNLGAKSKLVLAGKSPAAASPSPAPAPHASGGGAASSKSPNAAAAAAGVAAPVALVLALVGFLATV